MENGSSTLLNALLDSAFGLVTETIWPTRCAVCDVPGDLICQKCARVLHFIDVNMACPACGAPYGIIQCTECNRIILGLSERETIPLDGLAHALILDDASRRIISAYKDKGERRLSANIADIMARYLSPAWMRDRCVITCIPSTKQAFNRRGFDHAEELAHEISRRTGLEYKRLFCRPKSADQRALSRTKRMENMSESIRLLDNSSLDRDVLIIDDVCTTGATLYAAADALRHASTHRIFGLTFARVLD